MKNLMKLSTPTLREINAEILRDYIICIKDHNALSSWSEDVTEEPDAYSYSADELEQFFFLLNI